MPKAARTPEEVEAAKQRILEKALDIITERGYEGLSMRRLGRHLGMTAATVYNYFQNKEEIYLHVLTRGFELLYDDLLRASKSTDDPFEKLRAVLKAWLRFGLDQSNYYDIMLTLYIPKYRDFVGGPLEPLARKELTTALQVPDLIIKVLEELAEAYGNIRKEDAQIHFIQLMTAIHGVVSLYNNTILVYVHDHPKDILDSLVESHLSFFEPPKKLI
jgi:AcrR family transcriptional regulator